MSIRTFSSKPKVRLLLPLAAIVIAVAASVSAAALHRWAAGATRSELMEQKSLQNGIALTRQSAAPLCGSEFAYAQGLPASISLDKLVQTLQGSAKAFGVTVLSVSGEPHPPGARALESLNVSIALHGTYAGIKSSLAEGLARFPTAVVRQVQIKRAGAAQLAVEDASVQIAFALRPTLTALPECRMPTDSASSTSYRP